MSLADEIFVQNAEDILENGSHVCSGRAKWKDGNTAFTVKKFGVVNRYDLRKEFPAITVRETNIKAAFDEILWIYQKKSNNIHDLNSHIWDSWADEVGSIGNAYGYQIAHNRMRFKTSNIDKVVEEFPSASYSSVDDFILTIDQMDNVLYSLKYNPFDRAIMTTLWEPSELHKMNLRPCAWSVTYNVTKDKNNKLVLNMILNQRSNDFLAANNWNVVQYALLLMMVAQVNNMIPGELVHVIADQHIYDRHVDIVKGLITRKHHPAPIVTLDPEVKNFYDFRVSSLNIENYKFGGPQVKFEVAI